MQILRNKLVITAASVVIILALVLAFRHFTQGPAQVKLPIVTSLQISSPLANSKILGNTQIKATAETKEPVENLEAIVSSREGDSQSLIIKREDKNKISIIGMWQSGNIPVGNYTLKLAIYSKTSYPPAMLTSTDVPVSVITP